MDVGVAASKGDVVIMSTHTSGPDDTTPMQMISAERLAYLHRVEAAARALMAVLSTQLLE